MISKIKGLVLWAVLLVTGYFVVTLQNERYALMATIAASYKDKLHSCRMNESRAIQNRPLFGALAVRQ